MLDGSQPRFVVLEGIDGSGTTTQSERLSHALRTRGHEVCTTHEPSTGRIGTLARHGLGEGDADLSHDALALLFAADRLDHVAREIDPALRRGEIVVCDRYVLSSYAYQGLTCPPDWVAAINRRARVADVTFWLDLDAEVAAARVAARQRETGQSDERFDRLDLQRRLAASYRRLAEAEDPVIRVDAAASADDVAAAILRHCIEMGL
ncbi:MAG: dTMP kinase [Myxococcales bacterium FL481]|nr:MAG: dTMP kinase [Myxococcales bacterium FL481]